MNLPVMDHMVIHRHVGDTRRPLTATIIPKAVTMSIATLPALAAIAAIVFRANR
jgi:glutamate mutase epsilon subunit